MKLYHIINKNQWKLANKQGSYTPASLDSEGFIHASTKDQVLPTANRRYISQPDLAILVIDSQKVNADIKFEYSSGAGEQHPHIYGELNLDAVTNVLELVPDDNGTFTTFPKDK